MREVNWKQKHLKNLCLFDPPIPTVTYLFAILLSFQMYTKLFFSIFNYRTSSKERSGVCRCCDKVYASVSRLHVHIDNRYSLSYSAAHLLRIKAFFSAEPIFWDTGTIIVLSVWRITLCGMKNNNRHDIWICSFVMRWLDGTSTHFGSVQLTLSYCSWAGFLSDLSVLSAHSFASNWQLPFSIQRKKENVRIFFFFFVVTRSLRRNVPCARI